MPAHTLKTKKKGMEGEAEHLEREKEGLFKQQLKVAEGARACV
jgi:hypothetical protein